MFKEDMVAPCGLNCGICHEALRKENAPVVWVPTKQNPTIAPITVKSPFAIFAKHYPTAFATSARNFLVAR